MSFQPTSFRAIFTVGLLSVTALASIARTQDATWDGGPFSANANWSNGDNWLGGAPPANGGTVTFDTNSVENLATVNDIAALNLNGIVVGAVPGSTPLSIGGNSFTIGAGGIDMTSGGVAAVNQFLTIALGANQKITLGASQSWKLYSQNTGGSLQSIIVSSPIDGPVGADLAFGVTNNSTAASSSGIIDLQAPNTYLGNTSIGGPNTTYILGSNSPFGAGTVTQSSFNTAPRYQTNGAVTISNAMNWISGFMYTTASSGSLTFSGPILCTGAAGNRTVNNVSTLPITFNGPITLAAAGETTSKTLIFQATGDIIANGIIQDGDSVAGTVTKTGTGTAFLNNVANTFGGQFAIQNGTMEVKFLADRSVASSLGTGANFPDIRIGNTTTGGTLRYTGAANVSTNRPVSPFGSTGSATIENNGVGTMTFTADFVAGGNGTKTVTLTGTNTGANTIGGIIRDPTGTTKVSLAKTGSGNWNLSAANTYTGTTTVSAGTLLVNNTTSSGTGTGAVTVNGSGTLGGTGIIKPGTTVGVTIDTSGTLSPGVGIGTLTFDGAATSGALLTLASGATIFSELRNSLPSDQVTLINSAAGDLVFNSNTINFSDTTGGSLASGAYTLFTADSNAYSGLTDGGGNVTGLSIGTGLSAYPTKSLQLVGNNIVLNIGSATLTGDYNHDNKVDAADYVIWRKTNVGGATGYTDWRSNFGRPPGSGSGLGSAAVPEPTALVLAGVCLSIAGTLRRRRGTWQR